VVSGHGLEHYLRCAVHLHYDLSQTLYAPRTNSTNSTNSLLPRLFVLYTTPKYIINLTTQCPPSQEATRERLRSNEVIVVHSFTHLSLLLLPRHVKPTKSHTLPNNLTTTVLYNYILYSSSANTRSTIGSITFVFLTLAWGTPAHHEQPQPSSHHPLTHILFCRINTQTYNSPPTNTVQVRHPVIKRQHASSHRLLERSPRRVTASVCAGELAPLAPQPPFHLLPPQTWCLGEVRISPVWARWLRQLLD
jgi:hypothetical protein